jgi:hypothetical protein
MPVSHSCNSYPKRQRPSQKRISTSKNMSAEPRGRLEDERREKEWEAERARREKLLKARTGKFDRILEKAPAMFSAAQLRVFLRALVNLDPYTFAYDAVRRCQKPFVIKSAYLTLKRARRPALTWGFIHIPLLSRIVLYSQKRSIVGPVQFRTDVAPLTLR